MRTNICIVSLALVTLFLAGCATNRVEMDFGTSYKLAKFNQTLDPDAEKDLEPVYGIDGRAAGNTLEQYYKSFEKPLPDKPTFSITAPGMAR